MRNKFDIQLDILNEDLIKMGSLCEKAISCAVKALETGELYLAEKAMLYDEEIDHKERDIESLCLKLLLQQQPVARDLRLISAALKMITDMERIGDQAADIAEIIKVAKLKPSAGRIHISDMAEAAIAMVTNSISAFVNRDLQLSRDVVASDDTVDILFDTVRKELLELIRSDAGAGGYALDMLMIAKYLERIGDHATNVAEWVEFSITGVHISNE